MRADARSVSSVDIRTPAATGEPLGIVTAYSGLTIEVSDLDAAERFYGELLGFGPGRGAGEVRELALNDEQTLTLAQRDSPRIFPESGIHQAYRVPDPEEIAARLESFGVMVHRYHEDRESERSENRYCEDPSGNRVQLIKGRANGLDHVAVEAHDIEWAEVFYTQVLGARVECRIGWQMADFAGAWAWGSGDDDCMPGTRRWDTLYTDEKDTVPRPCAQLFVRFARGVSLAIYLPNVHRQEPPRRQFRGTPNVAFRVAAGRLDELEERLRTIRLRCMEAAPGFGGPYERDGDALYVRDTAGNFLEFRERR